MLGKTLLHHFFNLFPTAPAPIGSNTIYEVKEDTGWWEISRTGNASVTLRNWIIASDWCQVVQCDATRRHWVIFNPWDVVGIQSKVGGLEITEINERLILCT